MPIKKSVLEKKIYYRIAKVFFLMLPILPLILFLRGYINIQGITSKNIISVLQHHVIYNVYIALGLVAYYLILGLIWKIILYVAFGGFEDDMKKETPVVQTVQTAPATIQNNDGGIGWIIFIIIIIIFIATYSATPQNTNNNTSPNNNGTQTNTTQCVPTGCGNLWHCWGSYYDSNGVKVNVNACYNSGQRPPDYYSSWSGTCRQCP